MELLNQNFIGMGPRHKYFEVVPLVILVCALVDNAGHSKEVTTYIQGEGGQD